MTDLRHRLEILGLSQYTDAFITEGFDSWDTLLDIQESDLGYLNVKLGHRRKLQRAIAEARGVAAHLALPDNRKASLDASYRSDDSATEVKDRKGIPPTATAVGSSGTKRKYRRHPKPDENAPERPASAYVIFSNKVRIELKGQDLSFTDIAKTVGERWQVLPVEARDTFERQAATAKEKYYAELAEYKKTLLYAQYQEYLSEFKTKHAAPRAEEKRTKLETQTGASTRSSSQGNNYERSDTGRSPVPSLPDLHAHGAAQSTASPTAGAPYHPPLYQLATAASSPTAFGPALQSPTRRERYSPKAASPISSRSYATYELPHHRRSSSAAEPRHREPMPPGRSPQLPQSAFWPAPPENDGMKAGLDSIKSPRRSDWPPTSLPPLVRADTTVSSDGGMPPTPYLGSLLPPLDAPKAERMLPQPVPTAAGAALSAYSISQHSPPSVPANSGHWPALLRASELARDADLHQSGPNKKPAS